MCTTAGARALERSVDTQFAAPGDGGGASGSPYHSFATWAGASTKESEKQLPVTIAKHLGSGALP
jgi:hypothetical protein